MANHDDVEAMVRRAQQGPQMGIQVAAPMNDVQLVALLAATRLSAGRMLANEAVEDAIAILALTVAAFEAGAMQIALENARKMRQLQQSGDGRTQ